MVRPRCSVIRVGFVMTGKPEDWLGGLNYFRSLLGALEALDDRKIEPVLLIGRRHLAAWSRQFFGVRLVSTRLLDRWSLAWVLRKGIQALLGRDLLLQRCLRMSGVACLSHSAPLGPRSSLPVIGWIPDFQHIHQPDFFSSAESQQRDSAFSTLCRLCDCIIVSSNDTAKDLVAFSPSVANRVRIIHFVPRIPPVEDLPELRKLQQTYGFDRPFFHLPNQFWKHKNHAVVIDALSILRGSGRPMVVLSTGLTHDYRDPSHFEALMDKARNAGIENDFRVLGVIPFMDVLGLMRCSSALINPSLFEGWSTTVEEARRLGTPALLSDIPVHREQAVPGARYFPPRDAEALAKLMEEVSGTASFDRLPEGDQSYRAFGRAYQDVVLEVLGCVSAEDSFGTLERN
jgi:glycosyltransferase involved in cell wall biosynthesis